jgi:hypothetical protein
MKPSEAPRLHWGRRALGLALGGGLVGWIVVYVGLLVLLQAFVRMETGSNFHHEGGMDPGLEGALILGALAYGGPCGAALGLVIWSVWFLVSRRARVPDSNSSPHP